ETPWAGVGDAKAARTAPAASHWYARILRLLRLAVRSTGRHICSDAEVGEDSGGRIPVKPKLAAASDGAGTTGRVASKLSQNRTPTEKTAEKLRKLICQFRPSA